MCLLVMATLLPFDPPLHIDVQLDALPPPSLAISGAMLLTALLTLVAAIGLFRFRRWGRQLGSVALGIGVVLAWAAAQSPLSESLSVPSFLCLALAARLGSLRWCFPIFLPCPAGSSASGRDAISDLRLPGPSEKRRHGSHRQGMRMQRRHRWNLLSLYAWPARLVGKIAQGGQGAPVRHDHRPVCSGGRAGVFFKKTANGLRPAGAAPTHKMKLPRRSSPRLAAAFASSIGIKPVATEQASYVAACRRKRHCD
jgi:hypothetical protein